MHHLLAAREGHDAYAAFHEHHLCRSLFPGVHVELRAVYFYIAFGSMYDEGAARVAGHHEIGLAVEYHVTGLSEELFRVDHSCVAVQVDQRAVVQRQPVFLVLTGGDAPRF